jgi:hypothetical protein
MRQFTQKIENVPLKPYPRNARCHGKAQIKQVAPRSSALALSIRILPVSRMSGTRPMAASFYRSKHELVFVFKVGSAPHLNA